MRAPIAGNDLLLERKFHVQDINVAVWTLNRRDCGLGWGYIGTITAADRKPS
jgi:hypothetical protein